MTNSSNRLTLSNLFKKYLNETAKGKRLQRNGKLIASSTLRNYKAMDRNIVEFEKLNQPFLINLNFKHSKRSFDSEKRRYRKFYNDFTGFLYSKGCTDNYVGMMVKQLRSFFIYLNQHKGYNTGLFYKDFYARRDSIPVIALSMSQLQFLINDNEFNDILPSHLKASKDIFVLGCTIGLRFSDLIALKRKNLIKDGDKYYITTQSKKTGTETRIKLPPYAIDILKEYKGTPKTILPLISLNQFNKNLKSIGELAGWTYEIGKERSRRGIRKEVKNAKGKTFRFCDAMSSHMMRRTAITTLLINGMPEPLVRKISGHAAGSKEFYKYVQYSETFLDHETDRVFERMMKAVNIG